MPPSTSYSPPLHTVPQPHGGSINVGGTFPGAGRPSLAYKERMRLIAEEAVAGVRDVALDTQHPQWLGAVKFAADRGLGPVEEDKSASLNVTVRIIRDAVVSELPRLLAAADDVTPVEP